MKAFKVIKITESFNRPLKSFNTEAEAREFADKISANSYGSRVIVAINQNGILVEI